MTQRRCYFATLQGTARPMRLVSVNDSDGTADTPKTVICCIRQNRRWWCESYEPRKVPQRSVIFNKSHGYSNRSGGDGDDN